MRVPEWEPRFDEIQFRVNALLHMNGMRWKPDVPRFDHLVYERGFVEGVFADSDSFFEHWQFLARAIPLREVRITASDSAIHEIFSAITSIRLPRLVIDMRNYLQAAWHAPARAAYTHLVALSLERIGVYGIYLDDFTARRVFLPNCFPRLQRLNISGNRYRRGLVTNVARACPLLEELRAAANEEADYADRMRAGGAHELANGWSEIRLRFLALSHQQIGDAGLRSLADCPYMGKLEILDLSNNDIGTLGTTAIETLAASPHLRNVRWLNVRGNPIGNAGIRELILWPTLKELRKLDLSFCNITSAGARLIANQELHPDLVLDLSGNPISEECMTFLSGRFGSRIRPTISG